ncbi:traB family domain-containing protein [Ditylenchus destructor]|nr:traB family domain-containing protein [Ditylenchus destructor]
MDLSDDYAIDQSNQKYTYLSSGKTLSDVVSKEVYANVKQYIDDYRIEKSRGFDYTRPMEPITNVEMLFLSGAYVFYKPYWVATYLVQAMTGTGDSGTLDATLAFKALEQNKQVKGIVTPDEQLSAFSWLDDDGYGEYVLNSTVNRLKADQKFYATCYDKLLSDYLCGTLFTQDRIFEEDEEDKQFVRNICMRPFRTQSSMLPRIDSIEEDEEDKQFREKYLYETLSKRNRLWLPRIDRILRSQTQVFFAFGIAHMVGEDSVVELLQKQGYTVTLYANDEYTNDSGVILPVSIGARPDRLSFDFFANDFGSPDGVEYSGVKSRSLSAGLSNSASSMMISCLFLIGIWIF